MKYLVAGGAGFLGSHLCRALLDDGHEVVCLDSLLIGDLHSLPVGCDFITWDITQEVLVECDGIFHLASPTAPGDFNKFPKETIEANSEGTYKLLRLSKSLGVPLLFASSIRVKDTDDSVYAVSKRLGEILCNSFNAKIARMGNVYGPGMRYDDSRVIPTFIRQMKRKSPIVIFGDGEQEDSFCYVDDMVRGLCDFMYSSHVGVIEFGGPVVTIKQLAEEVAKNFSFANSIEYKNTELKYVGRKLPVLLDAATKLDWIFSIYLGEGLKRMI